MRLSKINDSNHQEWRRQAILTTNKNGTIQCHTGAVPPLMLKTEKNPGDLPINVFDDLRANHVHDPEGQGE